MHETIENSKCVSSFKVNRTEEKKGNYAQALERKRVKKATAFVPSRGFTLWMALIGDFL